MKMYSCITSWCCFIDVPAETIPLALVKFKCCLQPPFNSAIAVPSPDEKGGGLEESSELQCSIISFLYVCMVNTIYLLSFVETPRKFIIAELSIRKLGSSSVLIIRLFEFTRPFLYIKCRDCMLA